MTMELSILLITNFCAKAQIRCLINGKIPLVLFLT